MSNQFNNLYQEENAKAEQLGAGIALGCIGIPALIIILLVVIAIIAG
jgi:hypothetical protein